MEGNLVASQKKDSLVVGQGVEIGEGRIEIGMRGSKAGGD